ncbi:molecular chaperone DnaJ [Duganella sp. Leaf126]|uniref:J domain-containing protein n=1 Tax=Duganella sp. Leaf126 TaxID=1736266 RepID=UPI0006F6BF8E|nr:J domain-containing protein [Duganella sp. Leaf126]KQQ32590.1 molecular chaperone DnaJ [Duganella sp. Leaf126]
MGKVHTHYDNLKVSRMAPQEVIRAAYKALSQKYHPDKNPGDEKAARIMAIVNGAYTTLSDPQRRKEHDEWIAAEEWEVDWVESTRHEDHRADKGRPDSERWAPETVERAPRKRKLAARWKWGVSLFGSLAVGWIGGAITAEPNWLDKAWGGHAPPGISQARAAASEAAHQDSEQRELRALRGSLVAGDRSGAAERPAGIKVVAMSQVVLPSGDCDNNDTGVRAATLLAPNGEPWPRQSGYLEGFSVGNRGDDMQLMLDNANNASPVFIKVYDVDRRANVRYAYVQAHDRYMVDQLANGRYEIRYQNLDSSASCAAAPSRAADAHPRSSSLL